MDRTGEQAARFEMTSRFGRSAQLEEFSGNWLWMIFNRHLG